jgi:cell division transport system permease protein
MKENKEVKISYWAAHLTTIVSVTLVLLLVGIIALIWLSADTETRRLRERIELSVVMADSIPDSMAKELAGRIAGQPYCSSVTFVSKDQALRNWTEDTGENLEELFGVNPLSPEVNFYVRAEYASVGEIAKIRKSLEAVPGVASVAAPDASMVEAMNRNISSLTFILAAVAVIMLVISFVLINNTVHLTIYSRRFSIHTMQLVGATDGFIRRPIVMNNMLCGLVSGALAAGILALSLWAARSGNVFDIASFISWPELSFVAGGLLLLGMLLCALAAMIASSRYLKKDYDELFR